MAKEKTIEQEAYLCPVGRFFKELEKKGIGKKSKFREHLTRSRIEFLKAVRSILDERIEELEKQGTGKPKKKVTKIEVE